MEFVMTCNGRDNPLGVDREHIRLEFEQMEKCRIISYEFQVASSKENLMSGTFDIGNFTGECEGNRSVWIPAQCVSEKRRYYWQVLARTEIGIEVSKPAWFETGIDEWKADWICGGLDKTGDKCGTVWNFKKEFTVTGEIEKARLYICGLGYFDATLNDIPLDDMMYKPPVTDYMPRMHAETPTLYESNGHRAVYYTYDVHDLLENGKNELSVNVADGYFYNVEKVEYAYNFSFGTPRLIYELYLVEDGKEHVIRSDTDTLVCEKNYRSLLYHGDYIDFTKQDTDYRKSLSLQDKIGKPVSPQCAEDKVCMEFAPVTERYVDGGYLYDFGVNHTGGVTFFAEALRDGERIHICYAEILDEEGKPNYDTSIYDERSLEDGREEGTHQQSTYILKKGSNEIRPLYSWKCYRYVWIKRTGDVRISGLKSLFIHMDMKRTGAFECSCETLNRINETFVQTAYCNLHSGLLTDCPHREKRPYTGDGGQVMKSLLYNMDAVPYFYKWLDDMEDAQTPEGQIPNTVPNFGGGGGYAWGNAVCTLTKELYHYTGDRKVVERGYRILKGWMQYYENSRDSDFVIRGRGNVWLLGDWLAPDVVSSNVYYINTACYYIAADTAEYLAGILEDGGAEEWKKLKEQIAEGINKVFFDRKNLKYGHGVQGEDVLALALGIVPEEYELLLREKVRKHYTQETKYHLDTGIVLTPVLIRYLTERGYEDIAYRMMTSESYPSYYTLMENETTFSEHWSKMWPDFYIGEIGNSKLVKGGRDLSHCHPMYGSVTTWLYEKVAGLDLSRLYKREISVTPYFTEYLSHAKAHKKISYGTVSVEWEQTEDGLNLQVAIPENLTGICYFPSTYKEMECQDSDTLIRADENGFFHFTIPSGNWTYKAKK